MIRLTTFRKQSVSKEDETHESLGFKGVQKAPGTDLNVISLNQQQEGLQRVKNILNNPKSTYHIPTIVNSGKVRSSMHKEKVFCDPNKSNSIPCDSVSKTSQNLNVNNKKKHKIVMIGDSILENQLKM
jgi:hypothetical protein